MPTIDRLIRSIDGRIRELNSEITSLEDARAALTTDGSASTSSRKPQRRRPVRRRATRRTARSKPRTNPDRLTAESAERMLLERDGLTTAALAKRTGVSHGQALTLMRELEKAERVRRTGQRRGTRWHVITDEDRIQKRAAELATRRTRRKAA